jgi:methionyl-tRNA synthetase
LSGRAKGEGERETFYITTPIYYTNDNLHIGHTYTTVAADAIARFHRLRGVDTYFLTGTDEHGQKVQRRAEADGKDPQTFVDEIVEHIKALWAKMGISYDGFIRTTDPVHERVVQQIFEKILAKGDIYKAEYEGWYCTGCEAFFTETQYKDLGGRCPDHDAPFERLREESYFFRLGKYADRLLRHIETHPEFIQPVSRRNEIVSFIKQGLEDLCVSRTTFTWGIPVPSNPRHVIYVWFDALANYITAIGYLSDERKFRRYWPADVHLIGKEIVRFHCIIWPIMLMALDLPLPDKIFGHGWLQLESGKMSKSRGNVIDPLVLIDKYGVDAVRYYLLREIPFGADGYYTEDALILRTNVDLANDLGNLLSRTTAMINQAFGGRIPEPGPYEALDRELPTLAGQVLDEVERYFDDLEISSALASLWRLIDRSNKYIDETSPWALAREEKTRPRAGTVLYNLAETLRILGIALRPFLLEAPREIWKQLGVGGDINESTWQDAKTWGRLQPGLTVRRGTPLFPRIEVAKEGEGPARVQGKPAAQAEPVSAQVATTPPSPGEAGPSTDVGPAQISIDDFRRLDLRVATILTAERIKGADKLLRLDVQIGEEKRQLVAGIAKHYEPEALIGKSIVVVANLAPAKIRGLESRGMLLAASTDDGAQLGLVTPERPVPPGSRVK